MKRQEVRGNIVIFSKRKMPKPVVCSINFVVPRGFFWSPYRLLVYNLAAGVCRHVLPLRVLFSNWHFVTPTNSRHLPEVMWPSCFRLNQREIIAFLFSTDAKGCNVLKERLRRCLLNDSDVKNVKNKTKFSPMRRKF